MNSPSTEGFPNRNEGFSTSALRLFEFILIAVAATSYLIGTSPLDIGANDQSRLATVQSLVEKGSFIIDDISFGVSTCDKVKIGDHFYSSKPPLLPTLLAGQYWILYRFFGLEIGGERRNPSPEGGIGYIPPTERQIVTKILTFTFMGLPYLLMLLLFRKMLEQYVEDPLTRLAYLFGACFAIHPAGFLSTISNHVPAAATLFVAFYLAVGLWRGKLNPKPWRFAAAGFLAALTVTFDLPAVIWVFPLSLVLLIRFPKQTLLWFGLGALVPIIAHFSLTFCITKSLLPAYMKPDLYQYENSYLMNPVGIDALKEPKPIYLFHMLLGHNGLFSLWPIFLVSIFSGLTAIWRKNSEFRWERIGILVLTVGMVLFHLFISLHFNYGGVCYGFRWFIFFQPVLLFMGAFAMNGRRSRWTWLVFAILLGISLFSTRECTLRPWADKNGIWMAWFYRVY